MQFHDLPTPEWVAKNAGNKLRPAEIKRTGGEVEDCYIKQFRCPYDVLAEMEVLVNDYSHTVDMLFRSQQAFAGRTIRGESTSGNDTDTGALWRRIIREIKARDAAYIAWLGADLLDGMDLAGMRWGFYQTASHTETLLQLAQKIALDFMKEN